MTADPRRRRNASRVGIAALVVAVIVVVTLSVVAATTLRSSEEGTEVTPDARPVQVFPSTPAAMIGVTSGERLTSVVVAVVDPSGQGGSIVTVPVNIDTSSGTGPERTPLSRRAFSVDDPSPLDEELAPILSISPSFTEVVDADRLTELLGGIGGAIVRLQDPVVTVDEAGEPVEVAREGERRLETQQVVDILTAVPPPEDPAYDAHAADVAAWQGIADEWSLTNDPIELERDESGTPAEPVDLDELMTRVRAGSVSVRDLAIDQTAALTVDNETDADFVIVDGRDSLLVFASVAPERVLTPNPTLTFSIVAPFSLSQLAAANENFTTAGLVRDLIGELLFVEANVVAVDTKPAEDGAVTSRLVLFDEPDFEEAATVPLLIGPSTVRVPARDTDGSDVVFVLGTDFLDHRAELEAENEAATAEDDGADFDVSDGDPDDVSEADATSDDEDTSTADTVESDE